MGFLRETGVLKIGADFFRSEALVLSFFFFSRGGIAGSAPSSSNSGFSSGSNFLRYNPVLGGNPTLFLNLFISLLLSHLAQSVTLSTSIFFMLFN